jgi:hypothetical protein
MTTLEKLQARGFKLIDRRAKLSATETGAEEWLTWLPTLLPVRGSERRSRFTARAAECAGT